MSYADSRLYGGLKIGRLCGPVSPGPVPLTHCESVVPVVAIASGSSAFEPGCNPPPLHPRECDT